jgi:hypothetical protein
MENDIHTMMELKKQGSKGETRWGGRKEGARECRRKEGGRGRKWEKRINSRVTVVDGEARDGSHFVNSFGQKFKRGVLYQL